MPAKLLNFLKPKSTSSEIENPLERRRRFVSHICLFILALLLISSPITTNELFSRSVSTEILGEVILLTMMGIISVISWFAARANKVNLAAWLLLLSILGACTWLYLMIYHDVSCILAFLLTAMIGLIILGAKAAWGTILWGCGMTLYGGLTGNFIATDKTTGASIKYDLDTTFLIVILLLTTVALATYLANNLSRASELIKRQTDQLVAALGDIEQKRQLGEDVSHKVKSMTAELNATASQQSTGSSQQATALTQVTSFVEEMTSTAQSIARKATRLSVMAEQIKEATGQVKTTATEVKQAGEMGALTVERTIVSNETVSQLNAGLSGILGEMEKQQGQIREVVSLIKNISEETHLLALNAAIEAAGAGQFGERFKVVASEVKGLSERSKAASNEVGEILGQVENRIAEAVEAARESYEETQKALKAAQESGLVIKTLLMGTYRNAEQADQIEQTTLKMSTGVAEISRATEQQYVASGEALGTLQNIGTVATQNASGSEELTRSAEVLEKLSQNLLETLSK